VDFTETWRFSWGVAIVDLKYFKHQERALLLNFFERVNASTIGASPATFLSMAKPLPAGFSNRAGEPMDGIPMNPDDKK
jgi:hypothetical protein